jgi:sodium/hydrogen antiporter
VDAAAVLIVVTAVFLWGAVSARLERADLSAPIVFVAVGAVLSAAGLVEATTAPETFKPLVEITLVWVLFSDAARVPVQDLRADAGRYVRLLAFGLPLTVLAGWGLAAWLFPDLGIWLLLLIGAALAPTDAALGVPVVTNPAVPSRVRRLISVESGLNDGIATPVVMVALAGAASAEGLSDAPGLAEALLELAIGAGVGVAAGSGGGGLLRWARHRGWMAEDFAGVAVLALALAAYAAALVAHGNGFVAAFCGGLAFGWGGGPARPHRVGLHRADGRPGLAAGVAGVRRDRGTDHGGRRELGNRALRRPQPYRRADGPGLPGPPRRRPRPPHRPVHRLVRSPRPRVPIVRAARNRSTWVGCR